MRRRVSFGFLGFEFLCAHECLSLWLFFVFVPMEWEIKISGGGVMAVVWGQCCTFLGCWACKVCGHICASKLKYKCALFSFLFHPIICRYFSDRIEVYYKFSFWQKKEMCTRDLVLSIIKNSTKTRFPVEFGKNRTYTTTTTTTLYRKT